MGKRKVHLVTGSCYHAYNKSIAGYEIFRYREEYMRMRDAICFYRDSMPGFGFSESLKRSLGVNDPAIHGPKRVRLIAYCLMPTHIHFLMEQTAKNGIEDYMRYVQGSHAVFLNTRVGRKGPVWEGRFGARLITTDEDLLHMTRYIHLNPFSAGLVTDAEQWEFSSLLEYTVDENDDAICDFSKNVSTSPAQYRKFLADHTDYQRSLQVLKAHLLD